MRGVTVRVGTFVGIAVAAAALLGARPAGRSRLAVTIPNPVLFVTQVPVPGDFTTVASVFGNALGGLESAPRGGDLWIQYPDGTRKNLTQLAGFGQAGSQDGGGIAVREPSIHWSGTKAVFSMVIGAPTAQYVQGTYFWQLYEVTGLGAADAPVVTKVPNQPAGFNNVAPIYGTDERILFASDRPRNGAAHLYPQLDEYEEAPTVTGLWSLNPSTGDLRMLNHSPSGVFSPTIDSFGRVIFTRWDHLQRDQQADGDGPSGPFDQANPYGTFNFADESAGAARLATRAEVFPEPRSARADLLAGTNLEGHSLNHFFPWQIREDGTEEETLNHIGRHELNDYFNRVFNDDGNVVEFISVNSGRLNQNGIQNFLEIKEDPTTPGRYFGIDAPEFQTHAGGQIVRMDLPRGAQPDQIPVVYVTNRATSSPRLDTDPVPAGHSGFYRNPLPLSDGTLLAVHTSETRADLNEGTRAAPVSRYSFRIKSLAPVGDGTLTANQMLTTGIVKSAAYWDPDVRVTYTNATLWELDPVEVKARAKPVAAASPLPGPEASIFTQESVDPVAFKGWLAQRSLALIVSRDVTTRDALDKQQPYNLRIAGTSHQTAPTGGKLYDVAHLQLFQADQIRGIGGTASPKAGRRVLAQVMHEPTVTSTNLPNPGGPPGSVRLGNDGSMAALVPARRAVTWQMSDPAGTPVVRERYWLTFQPGEVRVCTSCHGLSSRDQVGRPEPANPPEALRQVVRYYRDVLNPASSPVASLFYTLPPCRVLDTRGAAGPLGAPALAAFSQRAVTLTGACGVPAGATALALNVTVTQTLGAGTLRLFPGGSVPTTATTISFAQGATRANNAQVKLAPDGSIGISNDAGGAVHVILDVFGYYR
ncbi:MAG: hypothetical protein NEA02_06435 [Thermoanaerobaculia bacterium]|nr:hypothetical protein [Thermoanaerobaculia bacterium]